jgi:Mrp family chromosome partitioning ATPase
VAVNLAFEAAPLLGEVLLVDADTYGGAVAHANILERRKCHCPGHVAGPAELPLLRVCELHTSVRAGLDW